MSKSIEDCINWIEMIKNQPLKPNIEDLNYLNSIKEYIEEYNKLKKKD